MAKSMQVSFGRMAMGMGPATAFSGVNQRHDAPLRIALLGDFNGRESRGLVEGELAQRRCRRLDRDSVDAVLAQLRPEIHLALGAAGTAPVAIHFEALDDFHPDRLFDRLEVFEKLRQLRRRLKNPQTFAAAAAELSAPSATPDLPSTVPPPAPASVSVDELLEALETQPPAAPSRDSTLDALIDEVVRPHVIPKADPRQEELVASVDAAIAELMRAILHHPHFQAIESAWRGADFLIARVEPEVHVFLIDVSRPELQADLTASDDLAATGLYRLLVENAVHVPGSEPWSVLAGLYTFGPTRADAELLGRMTRIAAAAGAALLAGASPMHLGATSFAPAPSTAAAAEDVEGDEAWLALRALPEAAWLGLALPRFILRLPYGARTMGTERFAFEEMPPEAPPHEAYLWGSPAVACAALLAEAFARQGWNMEPGMVQQIDGLPVHVYQDQGEATIKPCAETYLSERVAEMAGNLGLMTFLSFRNQGSARLYRFQSFADPPSPLRGRWSKPERSA